MKKVVRFPARKKKVKVIRNLDKIKFYNEKQIKLLRRTVRDKAEIKKTVTSIREWMCIDTLTQTGLRCFEVANLRVGDLKIGYGESRIFVREGKGSLSGHTQIPESLKRHLKWFLRWKQDRDEGIGPDDYLFMGQRGPWTTQAIQQMVKKYLKHLGLYENGKSVHALRHSYAVQLYSREKDLRAVQKQLRHKSIKNTQIYADVIDEDIKNQVQHLWG